MSNHLVAPSILAADFANLEREVKMINESQADWIHVDVMDGVFVPNFSLGIPVVEAIKRHAKKPKLDLNAISDERRCYDHRHRRKRKAMYVLQNFGKTFRKALDRYHSVRAGSSQQREVAVSPFTDSSDSQL